MEATSRPQSPFTSGPSVTRRSTGTAPADRKARVSTELDRITGDKAFRYNPSLDGLRAIAVAGVIAGHAGFKISGFHGVTVFFVISGYLITSLLLAEHSRTGGISLRHFYWRRFARLGPALTLVVLVTIAWLAATRVPLSNWWVGAVGALTYTTDLVSPAAGGRGVSSAFEWSWSLGIEEQFYLVWPMLLILLLKVRRNIRLLLAVLAAGVALSWTWKAALALLHRGSHEVAFYGPLSHIDALMLGVVVSVLMLRTNTAGRLRRVTKVIGPFGVGGLIVLAARPQGFPGLDRLDPTGSSQTAIFATTVLLWVVTTPNGAFSRVLSAHPLAFLGKLSYGLYLWNLLLVLIWSAAVGSAPADTPWGALWVVALLAICYLSWRFVETPLRRRWAPPHAHSVRTSSAGIDGRTGHPPDGVAAR